MTEVFEKFNIEDYVVARNVTVPFYIIKDDGTPSFLLFKSAIELDKTTFSERVRKGRKPEDPNKSVEPMHIAEVVELTSGEVYRLVCHDVLENTLKEAYKDNSYVNRAFRIEKTKAQGKRYFNFSVKELVKKTSQGTGDATKQHAGTGKK